MEKAVAVSFNWKTEELRYTNFSGPGAADKAVGWCRPESFMWKDYPESEGWTHFSNWNEEAGGLRSKRLTDNLFNEGLIVSETVPLPR